MCPSGEVSGCSHAEQPFSAILEPEASAAEVAAAVTYLYEREGMSTYRIGELVGMDRQRVGRLLRRTGVPLKPRGAGRRRRLGPEHAAADNQMARLYLESRLSSIQISDLTGVPARTVRDRLRASGIPMRTRGRVNREDRTTVPVDALAELYVDAGLSAGHVGRLLGVSGPIVLRAAHDEGLPVRLGGPEPSRGPTEIELIDALHADPLVRQALSRHGIVRRPAGGSIWQRFPIPLPVSPELAEELYLGCGLGVRHIELLTGQPAQTILRLLRALGITRRPAGGRSPFMRRWRTGVETAALANSDGGVDPAELIQAWRAAPENSAVEESGGPAPAA
jgi:hypothetical protein